MIPHPSGLTCVDPSFHILLPWTYLIYFSAVNKDHLTTAVLEWFSQSTLMNPASVTLRHSKPSPRSSTAPTLQHREVLHHHQLMALLHRPSVSAVLLASLLHLGQSWPPSSKVLHTQKSSMLGFSFMIHHVSKACFLFRATW